MSINNQAGYGSPSSLTFKTSGVVYASLGSYWASGLTEEHVKLESYPPVGLAFLDLVCRDSGSTNILSLQSGLTSSTKPFYAPALYDNFQRVYSANNPPPYVGAQQHYCRARRSTAQAIGNTTWTAISFDQEVWDDGENHWQVGAPTGVFARVDGLYQISGGMGFAAAAGGTRRYCALRLDGGTFIAMDGKIAQNNATYGPTFNVATMWFMAAGDYAELVCYQDSGANLNTTAGEHHQSFLTLLRVA
jgi:hypothetical protein